MGHVLSNCEHNHLSVTSSSVWVNLPAATALIIFFRYISLDLDVRRRTTASHKQLLVDQSTRKRSVELLKFPLEKLDWRTKVNSPAVEEAINQFSRHLVSEWVTDLWYRRITPNRDGPEELVKIINGALGEISSRARNINLINLLTRFWIFRFPCIYLIMITSGNFLFLV